MNSKEDLRKFRWGSLAIILVIVVIFEIGYRNFGVSFRMINDYYDRSHFLRIGSWILQGQVPYVDTVIEYPQITVYYFGLLNWLADALLQTGWPVGAGFMVIWYFFMGAFLWISSGQVWHLLPEGRKYLAWLMILPAAVYFSMNRFDILPVLISLLALIALKKEQYLLAAVLISVGIFTKWYLVFFVPPFLIYEWRTSRRLPWRSALALLVTGGLILLPTLLTGGWDALLQPYTWHLNRLVEPGTLLWLVYRGLGSTGTDWIQPGVLASLFTVFSFSGLLITCFLRVDTYQKVLLVSLASMLLFILFNRVFSPQWWLWVLPILLITARNRIDVILIVIYDVLDYLAFPVLYDLMGNQTLPYLLVSGTLSVLLIIFLKQLIVKYSDERKMEIA